MVSLSQENHQGNKLSSFSDDVQGGQERGTVVTRTFRWVGKIPGYLSFPIRLSSSEDQSCKELQHFGIYHEVSPLASFPLRGKRMTVIPNDRHDPRTHFSLCITSVWRALLSNGSYLSTLQHRSVVCRGQNRFQDKTALLPLGYQNKFGELTVQQHTSHRLLNTLYLQCKGIKMPLTMHEMTPK